MSAFPQDNPLLGLIELASGLWVSRAVWAAADLGIADVVGNDGAKVDEIAAATGAVPANLARLMPALASIGLFAAGPDGRYTQTEMSLFLRSDHPLSQRAFVASIFGGEHFDGWGALGPSLREGGTAFDRLAGRPVFDWYRDHPREAEAFSQGMAATTRLIEAMLLAAWTPPAFETAVDVGGSRGALVAGLLATRPDGSGILFDLPHVADAVRPTVSEPRITVVGGDFFEGVPPGDLYLLKMILHDWDDARSAAILANIRAACAPGAHVAIIDVLLPETVEPHPGFLMDLNMMVMTGGKERTAAEFESLLAEADFRLESITPTPTPMAVVQAVAI